MTSQYKLRVLWIRHGYSCSNAWHYHEKEKVQIPDYHRYTHLTEWGRKTSATVARKRLMQHLGRPPHRSKDYLVSSALMRSLETAALMVPEAKVHVYPYIAEEDTPRTDVPSSTVEYKDILKTKQYPVRADLTRIIGTAGKILPSAAKSDLSKFMYMILKEFSRFPIKPQTLIVVTHSHFIHDQIKGPYVYNNGIVEQYWDVKTPNMCAYTRPNLLWDGRAPPRTFADLKQHNGLCGCDNKLGNVCSCRHKPGEQHVHKVKK